MQGEEEEGGPPARRPTSRRPARRLLSALRLIFITRISLVVFFVSRTPKAWRLTQRDSYNSFVRTNAIDFYNEATTFTVN